MSANIDFVDIDVLGQEDLVLVHLFFDLLILDFIRLFSSA